MIRKVYEVDPMVCPQCGSQMKVISFLTDYAVVDRIIDHLKLTFVADRPPPPHLAYQEVLMAAEAGSDIFHDSLFDRKEQSARFPALFWLVYDVPAPFRPFHLNLTSEGTPVYHSLRRGEAKSVLERSFGRHSRKTNLLFST